MTNSIHTISERVYNANQSWMYEKVQTNYGAKLRVQICRNAYEMASGQHQDRLLGLHCVQLELEALLEGMNDCNAFVDSPNKPGG